MIPSVGPASVWEGDYTSVQMASVDPTTPVEVIGDPEGSKTLQFFYQSPLEDIKIGFPPVRVNTDDEVNCVVALVTEKAEDFNRGLLYLKEEQSGRQEQTCAILQQCSEGQINRGS